MARSEQFYTHGEIGCVDNWKPRPSAGIARGVGGARLMVRIFATHEMG
jgi:hypothetical protein